MMEFVKVTTVAQVKLGIDQVSAEYAVTGNMLERKLMQMATVEPGQTTETACPQWQELSTKCG
jgi:hypothetical protein